MHSVVLVHVAVIDVFKLVIEFFQLAVGERALQELPERNHANDEERKGGRRGGEFHGDQQADAGHLDDGEHVHLPRAHVSHVTLIRVVRRGDEEQPDAVTQLDVRQGGHAQVEEHAEQHCDRDVA